MKHAPAVAALAEAATGLALLLAPALAGRLLLEADLTGIAIPISRVLGIALLGLSVACISGGAAIRGMLLYSGLVTLYLAWIGIGGQWVGPLLWPAVAAHALIAISLAHGFPKRNL